MNALAHVQPASEHDLDCWEPLLYLDPTRKGFFALWRIDPDAGNKRRDRLLTEGKDIRKVERLGDGFQTMYPLSKLASVVQENQGRSDVYISQLMFRRPPPTKDGVPRAPNRQKENAAWTSVCFLDLDIRIERSDVNYFLHRIFEDMINHSIAAPSYVVFSGRGLHLKWLLAQAIPAKALNRWDTLQKHLVGRIGELGWDVDKNAKDRSRVLRMPGTINSRSARREACEVVWVNRCTDEGEIRRYEFDELCDLILPFSRSEYAALKLREYEANGRKWAQARAERQARYDERGKQIEDEKAARQKRCHLARASKGESTNGAANPRRLAYDRAQDIKTLLSLRAGISGDASADRESLIFWCAHFEAQCGSLAGDLVSRAQTLSEQYCPKDWVARHTSRWASHFSTLSGRFKKFSEGARNALYTPKNQTLIDCLRITPNEQKHLKTIIGKAEKARRRTARARARGVIERSVYEAQSKSRTKPWESEGVSRATYYRRQKSGLA